jgi:fused signal recognition particle receptor
MLGFFNKDKDKPQAEEKPKEESAGWFSKLKGALHRSSDSLSESITGVFTKKKLDDETLDALEDALIKADLGPAVARQCVEALRKDRFGKDISDIEVREALAEHIAEILEPYAKPADFSGHKPFVALLVGVNGAGKTTTLAKFAKQLQSEGKTSLLVAGDTFRAAAVSQLQVWADRIGVPVLSGEDGTDPASLAFKGVEEAKAKNIDVLLMDTAGRLHNKSDLMAELQKIVRVLKKQDESAPHAAFLVLDATTGQNALAQVDVFASMVPLTGLIITKLDGSARGGVLVGIAQKAKLPIVAIGAGEGIADLRPFTAKQFARALLGLEEAA